MKHYTIKINKNNNSNGSFNNNASKNLDNLILSGLIKMNPYLKKTDSLLDAMFNEADLNTGNHIIIPNRDNSYLLKDNSTEFIKAARFLANYTPNKNTYTLFDGTPIAFFEDEIQIGYDLIPLYKLSTPKYYNTFTPEIKKTIINIYISINR